MTVQLDIYGNEHPVKRRPRSLTEAQREIMRIARATGKVTALQAGIAVHVRRSSGPCESPRGSEPCCADCEKDGRLALDLLQAKELLSKSRDARDVWLP